MQSEDICHELSDNVIKKQDLFGNWTFQFRFLIILQKIGIL
jgi:hypothetical protein